MWASVNQSPPQPISNASNAQSLVTGLLLHRHRHDEIRNVAAAKLSHCSGATAVDLTLALSCRMPKLIPPTLMAMFCVATAVAQPSDSARHTQAPDAILLTVFLHHDQAKTLEEINKLEDTQGLYKAFPPAGTSVVSWTVVMGIGQVVTLEVPAAKLRDVNVALEKTAWKAFRTEFFPTYDYYPIVRDKLANKSHLSL
jgi:hypothetical protein